MKHHLKIWPEYFDDVASGVKPYEIRKNTDRSFAVGDDLVFQEWNPQPAKFYASEQAGYTGRITHKKITHITHGGRWGLPEGVCVLGLAPKAYTFSG